MMTAKMLVYVVMATCRVSGFGANLMMPDDQLPMESYIDARSEIPQEGGPPVALFVMPDKSQLKLTPMGKMKRHHLFVGKKSAIVNPFFSKNVDDVQTSETKKNHLFVGKRSQNDDDFPISRVKKNHLFVGKRSHTLMDEYQTPAMKKSHLFIGKRFQTETNDDVMHTSDIENRPSLDQTDKIYLSSPYDMKIYEILKYLISREFIPAGTKNYHQFVGK